MFRSAVLREFWINYVWLYRLRQITPWLTFKCRTLWHFHESLSDSVSCLFIDLKCSVLVSSTLGEKKIYSRSYYLIFIYFVLFCFVFRLVSYISTTIHFSLRVILTKTLEVLGNFIPPFFFLRSKFHVILPVRDVNTV